MHTHIKAARNTCQQVLDLRPGSIRDALLHLERYEIAMLRQNDGKQEYRRATIAMARRLRRLNETHLRSL